ncbi:MAG: hypothetical protein GF401_12275 [Chitinivibrionales bacterium]|nr:hypothetical protein [Chitinivibrionales bacterium]
MKSLTMRKSIFICIWAVVVVSAEKSTQTTISVYGFRSIDISQSLALSLQEQIESNLIHYGNFEVVSRTDMDKILAETRLQQQGVCSDSACLVKAGAILGVSKLVTGTVGKIGTTYNIVLKLIDISSGAIESSVNRRCRGEIDSLLPLTDRALEMLLVTSIKPEIIVKDSIVTITDTLITTITDTVFNTVEIEPYRGKEMKSNTEHSSAVQLSKKQQYKSIDSKKLGLGALSIISGIALVVAINSIL